MKARKREEEKCEQTWIRKKTVRRKQTVERKVTNKKEEIRHESINERDK